jgi:hypothetical protein
VPQHLHPCRAQRRDKIGALLPQQRHGASPHPPDCSQISRKGRPRS